MTIHERIYLNLVLLLLLVKFVSGFRLEWMYILLISSLANGFHLYQQNNSSESKVKLRQTSNCCKKVFEAAKFVCASKTKAFIFC